MIFKEKVFSTCTELLNTKIQQFKLSLHDLTQGAENDSKSSAGDKHETARAMMQLEHEKISKQLEETLLQKNELTKIEFISKATQVIKGSLIKTNHGYLFLSVAIGKITIDNTIVIVLSPQSPLGLKLMGLKKGETASINSTHYFIESIA